MMTAAEIQAHIDTIRQLPDLLEARVAGRHERWVIVWESVREDDWERIGLHTDVGETVLSHWLRTYANHCTIHIDRIDRVLAAGKS